MFPILINPLPLLLTLTTTFGVLVHDTQIDRATSTALALPVAIATLGAAEISLKAGEAHVHAERFSFAKNIEQLRFSQPRIQVRSEDEKKYVSVKKFTSNGVGSEYSWPTI